MPSYPNSPDQGEEHFADPNGRFRGMRSWKARTCTKEQWDALTERQKHGLDLPDGDDGFQEEARLRMTLQFDDGKIWYEIDLENLPHPSTYDNHPG